MNCGLLITCLTFVLQVTFTCTSPLEKSNQDEGEKNLLLKLAGGRVQTQENELDKLLNRLHFLQRRDDIEKYFPRRRRRSTLQTQRRRTPKIRSAGKSNRQESNSYDFKHQCADSDYRKNRHDIDLLIMDPDVKTDQSGHAQRREVDRLSFIIQTVKDMLNKSESSGGSIEFPSVEIGSPTSDVSVKPPGEKYMKTVCKKLPGRIVCKSGRYTFVINNGNYDLEPKTVANFVGLLYKRVQQGDRSFVVSVEEVPTTVGGDYNKQARRLYRSKSEDSDFPITVECDPVSLENVTMCNPNEEPWEIVFECRWHLLGLKKRAAVKWGDKSAMKFPCPTMPLNVRNYNDSCISTPPSQFCPTPSPSARTEMTKRPPCELTTTFSCPITTCRQSVPPGNPVTASTCQPILLPQL